MRQSLAISIFVLLSGEGALLAQAPATLSTQAAQCQAASNTFLNQKVADLRKTQPSITAAMIAPFQSEAKQMARDCAAKIDQASASVAELAGLVPLYLYTNDTAKALGVMSVARTRKGLSEAELSDLDLSALRLAIAAWDPFKGINPEGEKIVAAIDARSDAVLPQKISAHSSLLGRYEYADIEDGLRDHAEKLMPLARRALATNALGMSTRPGVQPYNLAYQSIAAAYSSLIRAAGDFFHTDSALKLIDAEERELASKYPFAKFEIDAQRAMYRLVGTRATPLEGKWWINGTDGATLTPGDGKVTLIQFTAHWCVPCKNSYPGFLRLSNRFAGKPFESVMETQLYGYIGKKMNLSPEQEVAEDRDYYTREHGLPFKIAVNPELARGDTVTKDNERRYSVNGIPQIVVVDKRGTIRAVVTGWDQGNEQRLGALIEQLLREK